MDINKTPISKLQELLQKLKAEPIYNLINDGTGTHESSFTYEVLGLGKSGIGVGKNKKEAKHNAAHDLFQKLSEEEKDEPMEKMSPYDENIKHNAIGELFDFCMNRGFPAPVYNLTRNEGLPHDKIFGFSCSVSSYCVNGESRTKKQAKHRSALLMLEKLKESLKNVPLSIPVVQKNELKIEPSVKKKILDLKIPLTSCVNSSGININDYPNIFKSEYFPKSETLEDIKVKNKSEYMNNDIIETVKLILKELQFEHSIKPLASKQKDVKFMHLTIYSSPSWALLGKGITEELACQDAYKKALEFMVDMAR